MVRSEDIHSTHSKRNIKVELDSKILDISSYLVFVAAVNHYPIASKQHMYNVYTFVSHCLAFFYTNYPKEDTFFMLERTLRQNNLLRNVWGKNK